MQHKKPDLGIQRCLIYTTILNESNYDKEEELETLNCNIQVTDVDKVILLA